MCNLYALTAGQQALRDLAAAMELGPVADDLGNLAPQPAIWPDAQAPVIGRARLPADGVVLRPARWGMPSPRRVLAGKRVDRGITNIRNTMSAHWQRWLGPAHRCLVPFTAFAEPVATAEGVRPLWFAVQGGPAGHLACFAGIAARWTGVRRLAEGEVTTTLFGFLTCPPNADVAPHHPKAMPVILTDPARMRHWLTADWPDAAPLQQPLPDGALRVLGHAGPDAIA